MEEGEGGAAKKASAIAASASIGHQPNTATKKPAICSTLHHHRQQLFAPTATNTPLMSPPPTLSSFHTTRGNRQIPDKDLLCLTSSSGIDDINEMWKAMS
ncbi:hypothetical protein NL676_017444 [Syzygium grande]|nr:hypothetical protein NL676_017444 [Syzygium grande]